MSASIENRRKLTTAQKLSLYSKKCLVERLEGALLLLRTLIIMTLLLITIVVFSLVSYSQLLSVHESTLELNEYREHHKITVNE